LEIIKKNLCSSIKTIYSAREWKTKRKSFDKVKKHKERIKSMWRKAPPLTPKMFLHWEVLISKPTVVRGLLNRKYNLWKPQSGKPSLSFETMNVYKTVAF